MDPMMQNNSQSGGGMNSGSPFMPAPKSNHAALIAVIIIVAVVAVLAYVFFSQDLLTSEAPANTTNSAAVVKTETVDSLSKSLESSVSVDSSAQLNAIDAEFK